VEEVLLDVGGTVVGVVVVDEGFSSPVEVVELLDVVAVPGVVAFLFALTVVVVLDEVVADSAGVPLAGLPLAGMPPST